MSRRRDFLQPTNRGRRACSSSSSSTDLSLAEDHLLNASTSSNASCDLPAGGLFELSVSDKFYNDYLNARVKRLLVKNMKEKYEKNVNNQFKAQLVKLVELKEARDETRDKLEEVDLKCEMGTQIKKLQDIVHQFQTISLQEQPLVRARELKQVLESAVGRVQLKNVKPIETEQEYNQLTSNLHKLNSLLESIGSNQGNNTTEINEVAKSVQELTELQQEMVQLIENITKVREQCTFSLLDVLSDKFAAKSAEENSTDDN